jgi:hypothetical protein
MATFALAYLARIAIRGEATSGAAGRLEEIAPPKPHLPHSIAVIIARGADH